MHTYIIYDKRHTAKFFLWLYEVSYVGDFFIYNVHVILCVIVRTLAINTHVCIYRSHLEVLRDPGASHFCVKKYLKRSVIYAFLHGVNRGCQYSRVLIFSEWNG